MIRHILFGLFAGSCLLVNEAVAQKQCGGDAIEIGRERTGPNTVELTCMCVDIEHIYVGGVCRPESEAPLSESVVSLLTGDAFEIGSELRAYAKGKFSAWDANGLNLIWLATLEAGEGGYQRARAMLSAAREKIDFDETLESVDALLDDLNRQLQASMDTEGPLDRPLPDQYFLESLDRRFHPRLMEAGLSRRFGDLDRSIDLYKSVLEDLPFDEDPSARREIINVLTDARRLRAFLNALDLDEKVKASSAARREGRAAIAALNLAWQLAELGAGDEALPLLREAEAYFNETAYLDALTPQLIALRVALLEENKSALVKFTSQPSYFRNPMSGTPNSVDESNMLFDAIEYGKGDWDRSVSFAQAAYRGWPEPEWLLVIDRLHEIKAMSEEADSQMSP